MGRRLQRVAASGGGETQGLLAIVRRRARGAALRDLRPRAPRTPAGGAPTHCLKRTPAASRPAGSGAPLRHQPAPRRLEVIGAGAGRPTGGGCAAVACRPPRCSALQGLRGCQRGGVQQMSTVPPAPRQAPRLGGAAPRGRSEDVPAGLLCPSQAFTLAGMPSWAVYSYIQAGTRNIQACTGGCSATPAPADRPHCCCACRFSCSIRSRRLMRGLPGDPPAGASPPLPPPAGAAGAGGRGAAADGAGAEGR